jgi:tRNA/rRNA methyltransferase
VLPRGVSITLVEPKGPVNVGHVARLVQNFGVEKLYLVAPHFDVSVASMYASHASRVLDDATVTTLEKVRKKNELLVATTAVRGSRSNVIRRTVAPERLHEILSRARTSSLVFGRDSTGLKNREIEMCDVTTTIDTSKSYRALNLGHAAAIILYLASRGSGSGRRKEQGRKAREIFASGFRDLAEASGVPGHKTQNLFEASKRIAASSGMTDAQLNLFSGVFKKAVAAVKTQERDSKT